MRRDLGRLVARCCGGQLGVQEAAVPGEAAVLLEIAREAFRHYVPRIGREPSPMSADYAAAARPFIYSKPLDGARVGTEFRYQVAAVRSLGDLRLRIVDGKESVSFLVKVKELIEDPETLLLEG